MLYNSIQKRENVFSFGVVELIRADTLSAVCIENGNFKQGFVISKFKKKVINLVQNFLRTSILSVNLVNDNNDTEVFFKSFLKNKTCLG